MYNGTNLIPMHSSGVNLERLFTVICLFVLTGCGVKGDPLPPEQPPRLGRGYPTYSKASEAVSPDYSASESEKKKKQKKEKSNEYSP